MKCLNCNYDNLTNASVCYRCGADLPIGTALTDADSVRVQRVGRLCARWRDEAVAMDDIANEEGDEEMIMVIECRERSRTLRACANALETEWAGTEPSDSSSASLRGEDAR